jgi:type III secretory pathway component EscS
MRSKTFLGVIGGICIAVAVFLTGNTITFSGAAIKETVPLILFIAAIAVIVFSLMSNGVAIGYAAMVAATIALIQLVDMFRSDSINFSVRLILLLVGVALALFASITRRRA